MGAFLDLTGQQFGRWLVLRRGEYRYSPATGRKVGQIGWLCRCLGCGAEHEVAGMSLRRGRSRGCRPCANAEMSAARTGEGNPGYTHGHARIGDPTFSSWTAMKSRCRNPKMKAYLQYGGRGITIAPPWLDFLTFLADMGPRPEGKTLDRIDTNGNYEPGNCRWATPAEQARNRRNTRGRYVDEEPNSTDT